MTDRIVLRLLVLAMGSGLLFGGPVRLSDPAAFSPQAVTILFDETRFNADLTNFYHEAGVLFRGQGGSVPTATFVELEPGFPMPVIDQVLRNLSEEGDAGDTDLLIQFDRPVLRVGATLGNGDPSTTATLTAISPSGENLGSVQQQGVDALQGPFVGIETTDPEGISIVILSFGAGENEEQINDLRFDFLQPRPFRTYLPQVAFGAVGDLQLDLSIQILNLLREPSDTVIRFTDVSGEPMPVTVGGETSSVLEFQLERFGARILRIEGTGALQVGYACIESNRPVDAQATYVVRRGGEFVSEASVNGSLSRINHLLPLERDGATGLDMGLAVTNLQDVTTFVVLTVRNEDQTELLLQDSLELAPREQQTFFLSERFQDLPQAVLGNVLVNAGGMVAVTGLRTRHGIPVSSLAASGTQR